MAALAAEEAPTEALRRMIKTDPERPSARAGGVVGRARAHAGQRRATAGDEAIPDADLAATVCGRRARWAPGSVTAWATSRLRCGRDCFCRGRGGAGATNVRCADDDMDLARPASAAAARAWPHLKDRGPLKGNGKRVRSPHATACCSTLHGGEMRRHHKSCRRISASDSKSSLDRRQTGSSDRSRVVMSDTDVA